MTDWAHQSSEGKTDARYLQSSIFSVRPSKPDRMVDQCPVGTMAPIAWAASGNRVVGAKAGSLVAQPIISWFTRTAENNQKGQLWTRLLLVSLALA